MPQSCWGESPVTLGKSEEGRPLRAWFYNTPFETHQPLDVLFIGGVHGDEGESTALLEAFQRYLATCSLEQRPTARFAVLPCLNPDGLQRSTRKNARGVDLNRNWPTQNWSPSLASDNYYGGEAPLSERETQVLAAFMATHPPRCIASFHTPYRVVNFDGPAEALAEQYAGLSGYPVEPSIGYPTPGSFGTWAGVEQGIPVLTLELPVSPLETLWQENQAAMLALLKTTRPYRAIA